VRLVVVLALLGCGDEAPAIDAPVSFDAAPDVAIDAPIPDGAACGAAGEPCCESTPLCNPNLACNPEGCVSCSICGPGTVCVQRWLGTCIGGSVECIPTSLNCINCTPECRDALCGSSAFSCGPQATCGGELPDSFKCYGP
jgi:hypothetical protein